MLLHLEAVLDAFIAAELQPRDLVQWAQLRRHGGAGGYTVNMELSKLGTVFRYGGSALELSLPDMVGSARPTLRHLQLIGVGNRRDRRPAKNEWHRLLAHLAGVRNAMSIIDLVRLMATSALRRGEVFRIQWADLDRKKKLVLVHDRKDPRAKQGNDQWIPFIEGSISGRYNFIHGDRKAMIDAIRKINPDLSEENIEGEVKRMLDRKIIDSGDALAKGIGALDLVRLRGFYHSMVMWTSPRWQPTSS